MDMAAFAEKLRRNPSKGEDLITIQDLILGTEESKSPNSEKALNGLRQAQTSILNEDFKKAATAVGTASILFKGGKAGIIER